MQGHFHQHSPNEQARLARQWMKERGIIVCTLSVGFIYLVARLARQWKNFYGVKDVRAQNVPTHRFFLNLPRRKVLDRSTFAKKAKKVGGHRARFRDKVHCQKLALL